MLKNFLDYKLVSASYVKLDSDGNILDRKIARVRGENVYIGDEFGAKHYSIETVNDFKYNEYGIPCFKVDEKFSSCDLRIGDVFSIIEFRQGNNYELWRSDRFIVVAPNVSIDELKTDRERGLYALGYLSNPTAYRNLSISSRYEEWILKHPKELILTMVKTGCTAYINEYIDITGFIIDDIHNVHFPNLWNMLSLNDQIRAYMSKLLLGKTAEATFLLENIHREENDYLHLEIFKDVLNLAPPEDIKRLIGYVKPLHSKRELRKYCTIKSRVNYVGAGYFENKDGIASVIVVDRNILTAEDISERQKILDNEFWLYDNFKEEQVINISKRGDMELLKRYVAETGARIPARFKSVLVDKQYCVENKSIWKTLYSKKETMECIAYMLNLEMLKACPTEIDYERLVLEDLVSTYVDNMDLSTLDMDELAYTLIDYDDIEQMRELVERDLLIRNHVLDYYREAEQFEEYDIMHMIDENYDSDIYEIKREDKGDFKIDVQDDKAVIKAYRGTKKFVVIPNEINGIKVDRIDEHFFDGEMRGLTSLERIRSENVQQFYANDFSVFRDIFTYDAAYIVANADTVDLCGYSWIDTTTAGIHDVGELKSGIIYGYNADDEIAILGYNGSDTDVVIPDKIEDTPVTSINNRAFKYSSIESICLGKYVREIGIRAFDYSKNLKNIQFNEGLEVIHHHAFEEADLDAITLPSTIKRVNSFAFAKNCRLHELILPHGLEYLGCGILQGCRNIHDIVIPSTLTNCKTNIEERDFDLITGAGPFGASGIHNIVFEEGMTELPEDLMTGYFALHSVKLPESLERIGKQSDYAWMQLPELRIPRNVREICISEMGFGTTPTRVIMENKHTEVQYYNTWNLTSATFEYEDGTIAEKVKIPRPMSEYDDDDDEW